MPHPLEDGSPRSGTKLWRLLGISLLLALGMVLLEVLLVALFSGQLPNRISSTLIANPGFFARYLLEAPGTTLKLLLIDKPLFEIAAVQTSTAVDIWRLHYFSHAILAHLGLGVLLVRYWHAVRRIGRQDLLLFGSGAVLLASSTLYLFHSSCCTGGPLWIIHTGLLASLFNPVTATVARLDVYTVVQPWLDWLQAGFALTGLLMLGLFLRSIRK